MLDPLGRQVLLALAHIGANLGEDMNLVAVAAGLEPAADGLLALAVVARHPDGI
ncbi:hypothetical protein D3C86_2138230 [compost metagenome]